MPKDLMQLLTTTLTLSETSEFINCYRKGEGLILPPAMPGIIGEMKETKMLSVKSCSFKKCVVYYGFTFPDKIEKEKNYLFKGIDEKEIINCHSSDSCPIYK